MMKIGMKLGIAFSVVTALLILVIYMGINTASTLNEAVQLLAKDRFPKTVWANNIIDALNENARAFRNAMLTNDPKEREKQIRRAKEVAPIVTSNMDSLRINSKTEEERRMVEELKGIRANYIKGREKLFDLISSDKKQEAADYLFGEFRQYQNEYLDKTNAIINYYTDLFNKSSIEAENTYNSQYTLLIVLGLIAVLLAIVLAVIVTRGITKPLNVGVNVAEEIARGNTNVSIEIKGKDETAVLLTAMKGMAETIKSIITEINNSVKMAKDGKLDYRADAGKYQGDFKDLVVGFNSTLDAIIGPLNVAAEYVDRISKGDIPPKITDEYKGDFNEIKNNLNTCIDAINALVADANMLSKAAVEGRLDTRADASKHQGDFRKIVQGVNDTLDAVIEPIKEASQVLGIMATGDLTARMLGDYRGDLAKLKQDINMLADSLSGLIQQVNELVDNTASSATEISATAEGLAAASQEQSAQADEVASAVEQMSRTITENAMAANKTAEVAKENGRIASEGGQVVSQTVNKMRDIAKVVKNSAENIEKLGESSKQIGEIISVIDDIADQTNLLALNAAIEAARAGEQGRGFAVVADEVRKLAERTTEATKQIAIMIKGIQSETEAAVLAMNKGTAEVTNGIELADKAGQSLQQILNSTQEVIDMINQIAAASEEQSATSEQISKNVTSISQVTAESAKRVEDVAHTAEELAKMTNQLADLMRQFKVDEYSSNMPMRQLSRNRAKQLESKLG